MDGFDLVMLLFFLIIPIALIVCLVMLARARRKLRQSRMEIRALTERLRQAESANNSKNGNQPNRL